MNELKVLYAIFVPAGRVRTLLDAIVLFGRPQAKHPAHITVRGPYPDYRDPRGWSAEVKGQQIEVGGVGTFFQESQNTVFLHAKSPAIRAVWDKPDYQGEYNPHLTIYDGRSREFAEALCRMLADRDPRFTFVAAGVEPIVLGNGPRPLRTLYDPSELEGLLDAPPSLSDLDTARPDQQLAWIAELIDSLASARCGA